MDLPVIVVFAMRPKLQLVALIYSHLQKPPLVRPIRSFFAAKDFHRVKDRVLGAAISDLHAEGFLDDQITFQLIRYVGPSLRPVPVPLCVHGQIPFVSDDWFEHNTDSSNLPFPTEPWFYSPRSYAPLPPPGRYRIEIIGRNHFLVSSPTATYAVDLESYVGHGACTCPHFLSRLAPDLDKNLDGPNHGWHSDCPHLRYVKWLVGKSLSPSPQRVFLSPVTIQ